MSFVQSSSPETVRAKLHLISLMLLLTTVVLSAACAKGPQPQDNSNTRETPTNPTPPPTSGSDRLLRDDGDRPIVISGGSTNLRFSFGDYTLVEPTPTPPDTRLTYVSGPDNKITSVNIFNDDEEPGGGGTDRYCEDIQKACRDGDCSIEVTFSRAAQSSMITIDSKSAGGVSIQFDSAMLLRRISKGGYFKRRFSISAIKYSQASGGELVPCGNVNRKTTIEINGIR